MDDHLLKTMQQDIHMIKNMMAELVIYMKSAESEIPESYRRFVNAFHDVHDIRYMYHEEGASCPTYIDDEIRRLDDRYRQILEKLNSGGGAFEKIRREMASDPKNRFDHTRLLAKPNGEGNETGSSKP